MDVAPTVADRTAHIQKMQSLLDSKREERAGVEAQSREFVGIFYGMMMQQMRSSLPGNPLVDGGRGEKMFQQQLDNHWGKEMAAESRLERLRDGTTRQHDNPLAVQFAASLSRSLDNQIEQTTQSLEKALETRRLLEDVQIKTAGRIGALEAK